ncbi:HD-GYP domain-containing protein [Aromatoleum buckelii]|uniref:HD domain-containing protein n=1 Tax=Aromatoleum buckelii TaxID=200254 RepID=A0ABX1N6U1_9RHOO|nr:HD domain-containing phosphohydrolase [Aromatoleum buckelii]MCK0512573.1 HD domain-containing protein [Aromatoleum buckelii]
MLFNSVNRHCLHNIVQLAQTHTVEAAEDIFDERGIKLWAKGRPVSADLQEKLLRRKLAKPLEATLAVEGAVAFSNVVDACRAQAEDNPLFARFASRDALALLGGLRTIPLPQPLRLLLTTAHANGNRSFGHALATILVCACIATRLNASEHDAQTLLTAALLHDLGEMYIHPDYLSGSQQLRPHDWKHVASHPRIGQLLIQELTTLPAAIGLCVAHHHERLDGSGYPNQLERSKLHRLGGWLAVAETVGAILSGGHPGAPLRAALALRLVPEEFDRDAVAAVTQALRKDGDSFGEDDCQGGADTHATHARLDRAITRAEDLHASLDTPFARQSVAMALQQLHNLEKSLRATGAAEAASLGEELDRQLVAESSQVAREIDWRMRSLARNLYLRAETHADGADLALLAPLIETLDDASPAGAAAASA